MLFSSLDHPGAIPQMLLLPPHKKKCVQASSWVGWALYLTFEFRTPVGKRHRTQFLVMAFHQPESSSSLEHFVTCPLLHGCYYSYLSGVWDCYPCVL